MYTTVVVLSKIPEDDEMQLIRAKSRELLKTLTVEYNRFTVIDYNKETEQLTVTRKWPDLVTAQAWIEFVNSLNPLPIRAEII